MKGRIKRDVIVRLISLFFRERFLASIGVGFLLGGVIANIAVPAVIREFLNSYGITNIANEYGFICSVFIGLFAIQGICFYLRSYLFSLIGNKTSRNLRLSVFTTLLNEEISFFDSSRTQDLVSRLSTDISALQDAVSIRLSVIFRYVLQVIAGILLMVFISPQLTGVVVLTLVVLVGFSFVLARKLRFYSKALQGEVAKVAGLAEESFSGIRVVKSFSIEERMKEIFSDVNEHILGLALGRARVSAFFQSFISFLLNASLVLIVAHGVVGVVRGELASGDLVAFLAYGAMVAISFSFITSSLTELAQASGAAERVFEVLDRNVELPKKVYGTQVKSREEEVLALEFNDVSFAYPARKDQNVVEDLSFKIKNGEKIAFVGSSGAGKSSVVQLLLGFYKPDHGTISLFGSDIFNNPEVVRERVRYVPQEPVLFALSISDNIRLGDLSTSDQQIKEICDRVGLGELIRELPDGINTSVGERGAQLSGGQKQRIAIARALIAKPDVLILDEATSALDSISEQKVLLAVKDLAPKATVISIAHRLSTIRDVDKIFVFEDGSIVEQGTHLELEKQSGLYSSLVRQQQLIGTVV